MDETCMFYHIEPNKTLSMKAIQRENVNKEHITLGLIINCMGLDKLKSIIIYKSKRPCYFGKSF
jgi:hypothetical protein